MKQDLFDRTEHRNSALLRLNSEKGSAFFFMLIALPLLLALSAFSLDLSRYFLLRSQAQGAADKIALAAARYLPDVTRAEKFIYRELSKLENLSVSRSSQGVPETQIATDGIFLKLRGEVRPLLLSALPHPKLKELKFDIEEASSVKTVPADTVLLFSDSQFQSPEFGTRWGSSLSWPQSPVLDFLTLACPADGTNCQRTNSEQGREWLSQKCFNPRFNALKQVIMDLEHSLSANASNRTTVISSPGSSQKRGFDFVSLTSSSDNWPSWVDSSGAYSDDLCVYLSDESTINQNPYANYYSSNDSSNCSPFRGAVIPSYFIPQGSLSDCFLDSLSVSQRIWYRSSRDRVASDQDIQNALRESLRLLAQGSEESVAKRGRLAAHSRKQLFAVVDSMPNLAPELIDTARRIGAEIKIIVYVDDSYSNAEQSIEAERAKISSFLDREISNVKIYLASNASQLRKLASQALLESNYHEVVISS